MTMWMVRADRGSRLYQSFKEKNVVAIGAGQIGNLADFSSREAILTKVGEVWPQWKKQAQIVIAGVLYRFSIVLKIGDQVITYDQTRRVYSVGKISGPCTFTPEFDDDAPNIRPVEWESDEFSRDELSTSTRNTLGSTLGLFLLPDVAETDVLRVIGQSSGSGDVGELETVSESEEDLLRDVEARSVEFIKDRVVRLDWSEMQELVAGLLRAMGYKTRVSPAGPDRGKDIVASPDGFGFEDPRIVVEVKHRPTSTMGSQEIRSFLGGRHPGDKGLYVSTGGFSKDAHYEAERANIPVTLLGLDELVEAIIANYDQIDNEIQRLIPLKRIYWPIE